MLNIIYIIPPVRLKGTNLDGTWIERFISYDRREEIKSCPPAVIIEIYDQDKVRNYPAASCHLLIVIIPWPWIVAGTHTVVGIVY